jgi:hypothetical protein
MSIDKRIRSVKKGCLSIPRFSRATILRVSASFPHNRLKKEEITQQSEITQFEEPPAKNKPITSRALVFAARPQL